MSHMMLSTPMPLELYITLITWIYYSNFYLEWICCVCLWYQAFCSISFIYLVFPKRDCLVLLTWYSRTIAVKMEPFLFSLACSHHFNPVNISHLMPFTVFHLAPISVWLDVNSQSIYKPAAAILLTWLYTGHSSEKTSNPS